MLTNFINGQVLYAADLNNAFNGAMGNSNPEFIGSVNANGSVGAAGQVLTSAGPSAPASWASVGSGTVTSVSVVSANGLSGSVANPTTTPAITLSTSLTGLLKGNGTGFLAAVASTDFVAPVPMPQPTD